MGALCVIAPEEIRSTPVSAIARTLCGGELEPGSVVDENWFLALERREFMGLLRNSKTQERVSHTLKTGKPLRN